MRDVLVRTGVFLTEEERMEIQMASQKDFLRWGIGHAKYLLGKIGIVDFAQVITSSEFIVVIERCALIYGLDNPERHPLCLLPTGEIAFVERVKDDIK